MRKAIRRFGPLVVPVMLAVLLAETARRGAAPPAGPAPASARYEALVVEAKQRTRTIPVKELKSRLEAGPLDFQLIDVREDSEWAAGRLAGAVHLSKGVLESKIEKAAPDPAARLVLYCASGSRSALAADNLRKMGYTNVLSLEGGMRAWLAAGGAATKP